jgi:DNA-binding IclR family transcriptional regulator
VPVTSLEKALDVCEALSGSRQGLSVTELARLLRQPAPTVHRLLAVLKRRGYVRQEDDTARYALTLKMLDLSFRLLGRSELRLHAYPVLRDYAIRTGNRSFIAIPSAGEVTYVWSTGPDEVAMHTAYGKEMPGHCSIYFDATQAKRRLSCLRLVRSADVARSAELLQRLGPASPAGEGPQRLLCTCAPVHDYSGREVARVGLFSHGQDEGALVSEHNREAWELARLISLRLGYLAATLPVTA